MEKVTFNRKGPFTDTECPKGMKKWTITGKESPIMAGSCSCRICRFHCTLPLAGKNTFGCYYEEDTENG